MKIQLESASQSVATTGDAEETKKSTAESILVDLLSNKVAQQPAKALNAFTQYSAAYYGHSVADPHFDDEENCLVNQVFVKDNKMKVNDYTAQTAKALGGKIEIVDFVRFEKGEGLEKRSDDFAAEVASMVK